MRSRERLILLGGLLGLLGAIAHGADPRQTLTPDVASDPAAALFVYEDIENFIRAHEQNALQAKYLDRATPGLRMFIQKYGLTLDRLEAAIQKHPDDYSSLDRILARLKSHEPSFRKAYSDLLEIVQDAVFPPTYFLVGAHRGIGSGSVEGPLIAVEKETAGSIEDDLVATLVHEMVHMQQLAALGEAYFAIFQGEERTLLALSIREGVATFLSRKTTGGSSHKNLARDYLIENEAKLWEKFRTEMLGHETGDWLWKQPDDPEQPQDVGYALGDRIVEAYYDRAENKASAVREILAVTDYPSFLARSGYEERFRREAGGH